MEKAGLLAGTLRGLASASLERDVDALLSVCLACVLAPRQFPERMRLPVTSQQHKSFQMKREHTC